MNSFLSVLPPLLAIVLALRTKQVYISLVAAIWLGWLILNDWNLMAGTVATLEGFVDVFKDAGNTRTIMFCSLVGALLIFIQYSGGVQGFINRIELRMNKWAKRGGGRDRMLIEIMALLTGILLFVDTSISSLTVGTLYRPLFDRLKIPREKLAYIADSSSAPSSILLPFNAWGAFITGLILAQGVERPFQTMFSAMVFNYYPILTILGVLIVVLGRKDIGPMAKAERRVREQGLLMNEGAQPMVSDELISHEMKEGVKPRAMNMLIPLGVMIGMMIVGLAATGWSKVEAPASFLDHLSRAHRYGSGSAAVLYAVTSSLFVAMVLYRAQGIMKLSKMVNLTLKGISELMPLALLMMLAFSISAVCKELGTGVWLAGVTEGWLSPELLPAVIFALTALIAFSTGTSWGTFAIMVAIALPMAQVHEANLFLVVAAVMGGGVFGDHCSPISDTTIISSMASASDHIDHVRTQLPYALIAGGITFILYLILGMLLH